MREVTGMCHSGRCNGEENSSAQIIHCVLYRHLCCYIGYKKLMLYKATLYQALPANLHLLNYCCFTCLILNLHGLIMKLTTRIIFIQSCTFSTDALFVYTHSLPQLICTLFIIFATTTNFSGNWNKNWHLYFAVNCNTVCTMFWETKEDKQSSESLWPICLMMKGGLYST